MKTGWQTKRLGDVCEIIKGRKPKLKTTKANGDLPYLVAKFMRGMQEPEFASVDDRNSVSVEQWETIIICDGSNSGEVFTGYRGILSSTMGKIAKKAEIYDGYLRAFLASTFEVFNGSKTGSAIPHLDKEAMYSLPFPIPPLPEQQRIVALLDEAFAGLATAQAHAERNLRNARALFETALTNAMLGKLTEKWRQSRSVSPTGDDLLEKILAQRRSEWPQKVKYDEPVPPSPIAGNAIPSSWTWTNLSQLKSFSLYGPRFSSEDYSNSGVLVLRTSDIDEKGRVNSDCAPKLRMTDEEFEKYRCNRGDLLFTRTGSLGTLAVFNDDIRAIPGAYLIQFRPVITDVIPWFLFAFFKSPKGQERLTGGAKGAGVPNLNVPTLEAIPIPFPPIEEQREIVAQLDTLSAETQRLTRLYEQKLAALAALKQSLLHQAFSGAL